jgi:PAS domain-containing protein
VFLIEDWIRFSLLQSRAHEVWALFFGSTLEDRPVYTPTDCFETFPFPSQFETNAALETAGREYYEFRAALMVKNNEGLTKTYNRFHDPNETSPDIIRLRELHAAMDRAVLEAYGWHDIAELARCEFLLDYEDEDDEDNGRVRRRKKPWRYRWSDDIRDEVLARLLALNAERAEEERLAGLASASGGKKGGKQKTRQKRKAIEGQPELI